jgi:A/G-specific adenine glycosylase
MGQKGTKPAAFSSRVLAWARRHGRSDLPWQVNRSPYRVWISEIMLQQTQVATVIPYFERFLARFPDVATLAQADQDDVLHLWSGLGYYARARNLHRAARIVLDEHAGRMPETRDALQALPGIGRSTAGAILALSLDQRHAILDGNVKRVLARWCGIEGSPSSSDVDKALWRCSEEVTPARRCGEYTQAIMDFGATLCTRREPSCLVCPVRADCYALQAGRVAELPTPRTARVRPTRSAWWLIRLCENGVFLVQRPARGLWGGLWGFEEFPDVGALQQRVRALDAPGADRARALPVIRHAFTHFELRITPVVHVAEGKIASGSAATDGRWFAFDKAAKLGLAKPVSDLLLLLADRQRA